ncbi:MAG: hypothetical protein KAR13_22405 [Desulfobulbaceae bacterium]|nr:hypothetical protein [Desulfobulbaceae bacterium]
MPDTDRLVINTGPLLALVAGLGDLTVLKTLYREVHVPAEVSQEIHAGGISGFGLSQFAEAFCYGQNGKDWLQA